MNPNQAVCIKCGVRVGEGSTFCANCGNVIPDPNATVCLNCGVAVSPRGNGGYLNGKDKVTMALICFFLGSLGIHNFMMGETKKGIAKIVATLCFYIGGILALIDFIKILSDKYEVDPDKFF